ncbi:MAG: hypothetical protein H6687_00560 [Bacillales bacterium]|nr:hypothetical protein [Bacillales bacterium]
MHSSGKFTRIISYILLATLVVVFGLFSLTYDFSLKQSERKIVSEETIRDNMGLIINNAYDSVQTTNILSVNIDSSFINDMISYAYNDAGEYIYSSDYWKIKNIVVSFSSQKIIVDIYTNYSYNFNYKIRIRAFFTLEEDDESYTLTLVKLNLGLLSVPSFLIKNILEKEDEKSIGSIVREAVNSIPFGEYDDAKLTYKIDKMAIISSLETGYLGDLLYADNTQAKIVIGNYLNTFFKNDFLDLEINKGFILSVDFSKIINREDTIQGTIIEDIFGFDQDYLNGKVYDIIFDYLTGNEDIVLNEYYLNALFNLLIAKNLLAMPDQDLFSYGSLYSVSLSLYLDNLYLDFTYETSGKYSIVRYVFNRTENVSYHLTKIVIGRDEGEEENAYTTITSTNDLLGFISVLSLYGIDTDKINLTISLDSFVSILPITYIGIAVDEGEVIISTNANPYVSLISEALQDKNGFRDNEEYNLSYSIRSSIDWENITTIQESFKDLSYLQKRELIEKLRDYLYERDILVYNYINHFMEGED